MAEDPSDEEGVFGTAGSSTSPIDLQDPTLVLTEDPSAPFPALGVLRNERIQGFLDTAEQHRTMGNRAEERYPMFAPPGSFPDDRSIYGVFDLAGNVRQWTGSRFPGDDAFYRIKGARGCVCSRFLYCSYASDTPVAPSDVGFRYVLELE